MEISLALIIDELGFDVTNYNVKKHNPLFSSVELLSLREINYQKNTLLVCYLTEAIEAASIYDFAKDVYFLCLNNVSNLSKLPSNVIVVNAQIDIREFYNAVSRIFSKMNNWMMAMAHSVSKRNGLKDLLDLSEPIFGNFITIQDSTFKLLCYTENVSPPGMVMSRLIKYGYHPPETMELFRKHRRLEQFNLITEVIVSRDNITSENDIVKKTIHLGSSILIMIVMDCCGRPANSATVEMFEILINYIKNYADIDIAQTGGIDGVKALAIDLLEGNAGGIEEARTRSTYCGHPFDNGHRLYVFSFVDDANTPTAHLINLLSEVFPDCVIFGWKHHVLFIEYVQANVHETCKNAKSTLGRIDFTCGISNDFGSLWDLPKALNQATIAMDMSLRVAQGQSRKAQTKFNLFSDYLIYYIVSASESACAGVLDDSFVSKCLATLRDYDEKHRTETAKILRIYLENERSATATASIMHMHRNTVLYHMDKVNSLLGLSLDDPDIRLQLLLAYKLDDLT